MIEQHLGIADIQYAINKILKENFPEVSRESSEVVEGYKLPSFYLHITPIRFSPESEYYRRLQVIVDIKYYSKLNTQLDYIKMRDALLKLFHITLNVKDRVLKLKDINSKFDNEETLTFSFQLDFITFFDKEENYELMLNIDTEYIKE